MKATSLRMMRLSGRAKRMGAIEMYTTFKSENLKGRHLVGDLKVVYKIILK
jgi:hypothetical protein